MLKDKGRYRFAFQDLIQAPVVVSGRPLEEDLGTEPVEKIQSVHQLWCCGLVTVTVRWH